MLCCTEPRFQAIPEALIQSGEEMAVTVEGDPDGGVPKPLLDLLRVRALGDEHGGACMPQVVEPQGIGRPALRTAGLKWRR